MRLATGDTPLLRFRPPRYARRVVHAENELVTGREAFPRSKQHLSVAMSGQLCCRGGMASAELDVALRVGQDAPEVPIFCAEVANTLLFWSSW